MMSGTRLLRRSDTFSLNVSPMIPTRLALTRQVRIDEHLDKLVRDVLAHAIVDAAAGQDDLGLVAQLLRLRGQVVRITPMQ